MFKVIDLETTTLLDSCEIAQLAMWEMDEEFQFVSHVNRYFNIHGDMPEDSYRVHHLSKYKLEELSKGIFFDDVKDEIYNLIDDAILVAHNAQFEKKILTYRFGSEIMSRDWICTMLRYTPTMKLKDNRNNGGFKYCNLRELFSFIVNESGKSVSYYNDMYKDMTGGVTNFHNALYDSFCTGLALQVLG